MALAIAAAALGGLVIGWGLNGVAARFGVARWSSHPRAVAACTAVLCAGTAAVHHDDHATLMLGLVLFTFLIPLTLVDLEMHLLPNRLTAPAAVAAIVLGTALDAGGEIERLAAGAAAAGFFLCAALVNPRGMGIGDVKLAGVLGLFLGSSVSVALFAALMAGLLAGVVIMRRVGVAAGRKQKVPFGPFLALGGVVGVLAGGPLVDVYLTTF